MRQTMRQARQARHASAAPQRIEFNHVQANARSSKAQTLKMLVSILSFRTHTLSMLPRMGGRPPCKQTRSVVRVHSLHRFHLSRPERHGLPLQSEPPLSNMPHPIERERERKKKLNRPKNLSHLSPQKESGPSSAATSLRELQWAPS